MNASKQEIVVGYDGSPDADAAASWAVEVARQRREPLVAILVMEPVESSRSPYGMPESIWRDIEEQGREMLASAGAGDVAIERHTGPIAPTLVERAREASMLVLGSRGHSRVSEILLGSVSQNAARHALCPVVVVRQTQAAPDAHRIAVGVDGSEPSLRAVDFACQQAVFTGQDVVLVRAWKPLTIPIDKEGHVPHSMSATLLEEEEALARDVSEARPATRRWESGELIVTGAGQALVDVSNTASMVAVGSRGRQAMAATLLGSVRQVLHRARCPVAVVR